jgi:hypothetical protein
MPCCYEDKFSIGHFNMVRKINFEDGVGYVACLRLPNEDLCSAPPNMIASSERMAQIQATVASFRFPRIGSLYHDSYTDGFYIGPELQTGRAPWTSSTEYYDDLVDHLLKSASTTDELKQSQSFMLPSILGHLTRIHKERSGPFRLTNRDSGAHNILVNDNFEIVGVIDFDGVMVALEASEDGGGLCWKRVTGP